MAGTSKELRDRLEAVGRDLLASPGVGGHLHFDDPVFAGLVPDFHDKAWIGIAGEAARIFTSWAAPFLLAVPLGQWHEMPLAFSVERLDDLEPWEPPALYILTEQSAFEYRKRGWYTDAAPQVEGTHGWVGAYLDDDVDGPPVWKATLMYESR